jgi:hypothetical protein
LKSVERTPLLAYRARLVAFILANAFGAQCETNMSHHIALRINVYTSEVENISGRHYNLVS